MLQQENGAKYFVELSTRDILALMGLIGQWGCTALSFYGPIPDNLSLSLFASHSWHGQSSPPTPSALLEHSLMAYDNLHTQSTSW